jgi:MoxR-like ATPase
MAKFVQKLRNWYGANPVPYPDKLYSAQDRVFFQTGEELIGRILRAIQLNQSVVLSGPRGCGKSKCIELAIARAEKEGIIPPQGWIKSQGNKEIPRDYLAEDGLTFRFTTDKDGEKVNPAKQKAPFFKFAVRDEQFQEPVRDPSTRRVDCQIRRPGDPSGVKRPVPRFIVFLDEINRFSDGVLDSLLTVLEERTVILAGDEYKLPVVVCMTMNPPGYDATARKLSPPLAARISRSYRLYTPDLDTLTDVIIRGKMREQAEYRFLFAFDMLRATKDVLDAVAKCRADLNPHLLESVSAAADYRDSVASLAASLNTRRKDGLLSFAGILPGLKKLLAELKSKLPLREDIVHLLKAAESEGELEKEANSLPSRLQECLDLLSQIIELEELFPNIEVALQRKVALVTLCLWGEPSERKPAASDPAEPQNADGSLVAEWRTAWNAGLRAFRRSAPSTETKPGHEYLTADTVDLLQRLADRNGALCRDMQTVGLALDRHRFGRRTASPA